MCSVAWDTFCGLLILFHFSLRLPPPAGFACLGHGGECCAAAAAAAVVVVVVVVVCLLLFVERPSKVYLRDGSARALLYDVLPR